MTQQTKRPNLLPYLLVLLVLVGVYGFMNKPVEAEPSYAEVRELFESEQVSAFTVTDTTLRMKLREPIDGKTELKKDLFSVTLFYDDLGELIEQQKADGIIEDYDFTADHSINYVAMCSAFSPSGPSSPSAPRAEAAATAWQNSARRRSRPAETTSAPRRSLTSPVRMRKKRNCRRSSTF